MAQDDGLYDERLSSVDDQLCELLKKRIGISDGKPGTPTEEMIAYWSKKHDLATNFISYIFSMLENAKILMDRVEPKNFRKYVPVLKSVEKDDYLYTITFIKQYENAS